MTILENMSSRNQSKNHYQKLHYAKTYLLKVYSYLENLPFRFFSFWDNLLWFSTLGLLKVGREETFVEIRQIY